MWWSEPGGAADAGEPGARARARRVYFEYSSTMSCSCTGAAISARSGLRSTFAVSASWSACSQAGTCAVELGRVADDLLGVGAGA